MTTPHEFAELAYAEQTLRKYKGVGMVTAASEPPGEVHAPAAYVSASPPELRQSRMDGVVRRFPLVGSAPAKRSPKVIDNALIAGFHRIIPRARPRPVGSAERVTK